MDRNCASSDEETTEVFAVGSSLKKDMSPFKQIRKKNKWAYLEKAERNDGDTPRCVVKRNDNEILPLASPHRVKSNKVDEGTPRLE
jgi:hypothetical protein